MASEMLLHALYIINSYLAHDHTDDKLRTIRGEMNALTGGLAADDSDTRSYSYEETQAALSCLNERESIRKNKGVYYTPSDVVEFILTNSVGLACGRQGRSVFPAADLNGVPYGAFCYRKTVYDPTCGAGSFLLAALELKLDLLERQQVAATRSRIRRIVATIRGNDLNPDSIAITKLRLFLCVLHRYGTAGIRGLAPVMNACFSCYDYVAQRPDPNSRYDVIVGNPPYVEDGKSESAPEKRYGNIYANVLEHAALQLSPGGVMGFIVPLSYVSTPRMEQIRKALFHHVPEQYILSFSDRPDCLFSSVHQKLCVLFGKNVNKRPTVCTGNYQYWYREERRELFRGAQTVKNAFVTDAYIPKLGNELDISVYKKLKAKRTPLMKLLQEGGTPVYLNMRAAFWIKAFLREHAGSEYRAFGCRDENRADFVLCLLNSSLFWWYWICVSDCWHITRKELEGFRVPIPHGYEEAARLAAALEKRLEETKVFVGTRQTEYEYKHRDCVEEIHRIDDWVNALYGLTEEESLYIKDFAYRYRISGGVEDERN